MILDEKGLLRKWTNKMKNNKITQEIETNYKQIKTDIVQVIETELERIKNDPDLQHLVQQG